MSNAAPIKLRQVRDLGEVISTTFSYVKLHFRKLYTALLLSCLPGMLIGGLLINSFFSSLATGMGQIYSAPEPPLASMFFGYLVMILTMLLMLAVVNRHMKADADGTLAFTAPGKIVGQALSDVLPYLVICFPVAFLCMVGFVLFVFPGIWLMIAFSFVFLVRTVEGIGIFDTLGRSFKLTSDHWWTTFGILFLIGIIVNLISYAIMLPLMALFGFGALSGVNVDGDPTAVFSMMGAMFAVIGVLSLLLYPLNSVALGLQYFNLVELKERRGLGETIQDFDQL